MPRYYKLYVNTGLAGCKHEEIIEVPDDEEFPSEAELEEIARDYMFNCIEFGFNECDEDGDSIGK